MSDAVDRLNEAYRVEGLLLNVGDSRLESLGRVSMWDALCLATLVDLHKLLRFG